jgi:hypothetical protein
MTSAGHVCFPFQKISSVLLEAAPFLSHLQTQVPLFAMICFQTLYLLSFPIRFYYGLQESKWLFALKLNEKNAKHIKVQKHYAESLQKAVDVRADVEVNFWHVSLLSQKSQILF